MTGKVPKSTHSNGSSGGAGGATPPQGGVAGPPVGPAAGITAWWRSFSGKHGQNLKNATASMKTKLQSTKFSMPVDVKVDILRPTVEAVKETSHSVWVKLPPPVQQAAPYIGVAMGSSAVVYLIQQRRIKRLEEKRQELQVRVDNLQREKEDLIKRINSLEIKFGTSRIEAESRMAVAVAEATNAAAAAADAAARAATACILQKPKTFADERGIMS